MNHRDLTNYIVNKDLYKDSGTSLTGRMAINENGLTGMICEIHTIGESMVYSGIGLETGNKDWVSLDPVVFNFDFTPDCLKAAAIFLHHKASERRMRSAPGPMSMGPEGMYTAGPSGFISYKSDSGSMPPAMLNFIKELFDRLNMEHPDDDEDRSAS